MADTDRDPILARADELEEALAALGGSIARADYERSTAMQWTRQRDVAIYDLMLVTVYAERCAATAHLNVYADTAEALASRIRGMLAAAGDEAGPWDAALDALEAKLREGDGDA